MRKQRHKCTNNGDKVIARLEDACGAKYRTPQIVFVFTGNFLQTNQVQTSMKQWLLLLWTKLNKEMFGKYWMTLLSPLS